MNPFNGDIWLVNLNPAKRDNEMGKIRPSVIFQNDELNNSGYPTTIIIPLSTQLIDDAKPIRLRIKKRENLEKDSDMVLTQVRSIDKSRLIKKIAQLTHQEQRELKKLFLEIVSN
jgi:mRNA interferase MazF